MSTLERIGNIDGAQRRLRLLNGIIVGVTAIAFCYWVIHGEHDPWWFLAAPPLFIGSILGLLQAQAST